MKAIKYFFVIFMYMTRQPFNRIQPFNLGGLVVLGAQMRRRLCCLESSDSDHPSSSDSKVAAADEVEV